MQKKVSTRKGRQQIRKAGREGEFDSDETHGQYRHFESKLQIDTQGVETQILEQTFSEYIQREMDDMGLIIDDKV